MTSSAGACLCKSVTLSVSGDPILSDACHCPMCRVQNGGGAFHAVHYDHGVTLNGESLRWYRSSDYGERGFCATCGSTLAWRMQGADDAMALSLALFDTAPTQIKMRIFTDKAADYVALPDDVPHLTQTESIAMFTKLAAEKSKS